MECKINRGLRIADCGLRPSFRIDRKGFIHTLEAILATFLVLGFVIFLLPVIYDLPETGQIERQRMSERLESMDITGDLSNYVSGGSANLSGLKGKIDSEGNPLYNSSVGMVSYASETAYGNREVNVVQGENIIAEVVVSAIKGGKIDLPETIVWDAGGPRSTSAAGETVNFTSMPLSETQLRVSFVSLAPAGEYRYRIKKVEIYGSAPENKSVWTSAYLTSGNTLQVFSNTS